MPDESEEPLTPSAGGELLTSEELLRVVRLMTGMGVKKVRLTGGEPTIRGDFSRIVEGLGEVSADAPQPLELGLTTNGVRLKKFLPHLRAAGLRGVNLSLDTLVPAKFPLIARRPLEWHGRVMEAMREVMEQEESFKLKLNCVLLRGVNEDEIGEFVNLTKHHSVEVRFLEFMPFTGNGWSANRLVPQAAILDAVEQHLDRAGGSRLERLPPDRPDDVARLWKVHGWRGRIGVIASMTDAFCGGCSRLRLTSDGQLRNCLFGEQGWSLRDEMRRGACNDDLRSVIAEGVSKKFAKLGGKRDMHELRERGDLNLPMVALGG